MKQVNIHDAKTQLSRLVAEAVEGRPFVIARAGKPLVEVRALPPSSSTHARIGFLSATGPQTRVKDIGSDWVDLMDGSGD